MGHEIFIYTHGPYSHFPLRRAILRDGVLGELVVFDVLELEG